MSDELFQLRRYRDFVQCPEKLQYRSRRNVAEIGIQEPLWTDWIDVPLFIPPLSNEEG